jgi:hypothetical protein
LEPESSRRVEAAVKNLRDQFERLISQCMSDEDFVTQLFKPKPSSAIIKEKELEQGGPVEKVKKQTNMKITDMLLKR